MNAPSLRPRGCPAGVDPRKWRKAAIARVEQLQDAMLAIIAALDEMDGDCDLEDNADFEPSLGGLPFVLRSGKVIEDGELDEADREPDTDDEPSLGWGFDDASQLSPHRTPWRDLEQDAVPVEVAL